MTIQSNSLLNAERPLWYKQPEAVNRWFNGVFEGGGAKGIAFAGALKALKRRRCWFNSVAGSSAGSITAALIASGSLALTRTDPPLPIRMSPPELQSF